MKHWVGRFLRERLTWFVLIGALLFGVDLWRQRQADHDIQISLPLVEKLVAQWTGQTKRPPSPQDLDLLIEGYIREEILVREARRLGMDVDDVIIRRRLAQKMEFVLGEDQLDVDQPDDQVLRAYYEANPTLFRVPARRSFRHIFLGPHAENASELIMRARTAPDMWRQMGQPFMLQREYLERSFNDVAETFGGEFAQSVFEITDEQWQGPIASAYGHHLVSVTAQSPEIMPEFATVIDRVAQTWLKQQENQAAEAAWQALRASYRVTFLPVSDLAELDEPAASSD